ncbi:MAG: acetyl-CoA C-acetyltransferase [Candidatus Thermoplasmatota archaeon]|nr:acetyl-CoA C-acetyltransferase [Candidatus Thermoplasmatota archaeon]
MPNSYVISAVRTPIGKFGRSLSKIKAVELGAAAIRGAVEKANIDPAAVEEVIFGNVIQAGNGQNPAGQAATMAGLSDTVVKNTVNVVCASGMLAVENADREISLGEKDIIIAGGMESMSNAPFLLPADLRWGPKQLLFKNYKIDDAMLRDGLMDAFYFEHMGNSAELTARKYSITREAADSYALRSQQLAMKAQEAGIFEKECVRMDALSRDEGIRNTSMQDLSRLPAAFDRNGILTAGNSSQLSDGASALVLASEKAVREMDLKPVAVIEGYSSASLNSRDYVEAPIPSTKSLLEKMNRKIDSYDLVEHNEAFSVASIVVRDQLKIDDEKFNVNGGAIALGHPLGNSGSRIIVTLINALRNRKETFGLATLCHGGGGGHSLSIRML